MHGDPPESSRNFPPIGGENTSKGRTILTNRRVATLTAAAVGAMLLAGAGIAPAVADDGHGDQGDHRAGHGGTRSTSCCSRWTACTRRTWTGTSRRTRTPRWPRWSTTASSYTHAQTPVPSDSFPGMVGQVTGGNPGTTGVYYDDTYNRALLPAGTTELRDREARRRGGLHRGRWTRTRTRSTPARAWPACPAASSR